MSSRFLDRAGRAARRLLLPALALALTGAVPLDRAAAGQGVLRVCADPNNLPFSNSRQEGLENRLAELVGRDLGVRVSYTWWPQRRGFFRQTLNAGRCGVVPVAPAVEPSGVPLTFSIAVGVRKGDDSLRLALDRVLERRYREIQRILDDYGVPQVASAGEQP